MRNPLPYLLGQALVWMCLVLPASATPDHTMITLEKIVAVQVPRSEDRSVPPGSDTIARADEGLLLAQATATKIATVRGPDPGMVDRLLSLVDCSHLPSQLTLLGVTATKCEAVKSDLRLRLAGYAVAGTATPGQRLAMFLSANCDPATDFRTLVEREVVASITSRMGSFVGAFSDFVMSIFKGNWNTISTIIIPANGKFEVALFAPVSATVVTAAAPAGTLCSNSRRLR